MSQATDWSIPLAPPLSPTDAAARLDASLNAILSQHSGSSRPSYAVAGTRWIDIVSGAEWNVYLYDGESDILEGTFNPTAHTWTPAGASGALLITNNLSDLGNAATARSNLGVSVAAFEFMIDGGGATITTGLKGWIEVPFAFTPVTWTLLADQSGSIVVDIFKCTYSAYDPTTHPASGDKITASAPPTITTAKKNQSSTLTGWNTTVNAGDILAFNVNSVTSITRCTLSLKGTR